jgi:hypothetical protein
MDTSKIENVLAFGDSFVAGAEINLDWYHKFNLYITGNLNYNLLDECSKPYTSPDKVAKYFNVPCYNFAITGGSNDRSLRILTNEVTKYKNSLILFGYTSTDRKEFYYPDSGNFLARDNDNFIQVGMQWEKDKDEVKNATIKHPFNHDYIEKIARPYNNLYQTMLCTESIARINGHMIIHIPLMFEILPDTISSILPFGDYNNYYDWSRANQFEEGKWGHFKEESHIALAKHIIEYIEING